MTETKLQNALKQWDFYQIAKLTGEGQQKDLQKKAR